MVSLRLKNNLAAFSYALKNILKNDKKSDVYMQIWNHLTHVNLTDSNIRFLYGNQGMTRLITIEYNQMLQLWLLNSLIDFKVQSKKKVH